MLGFSLSILTMIVIFMVSALVLVKLYRHRVKPWMVHTALTLCALFYLAFRPFEISREFFEVYLIFAVASIFVTEKPVSKKDDSNAEETKERKHHSSSLSDSILSVVLLYGIFDYFDEGDDW